MAERIGFVGLGRMGLPMTANLVAAGYRVVAVDLVPEARARAASVGAEATSELGDLAASVDLLMLMLPDSDAVEAVLAGAEAAGVLRPGLLVVDLSSSQPLRTQATAARLAEQGVRMIDAPVSGGVAGAEKGTLTIMVGGDEADIRHARPALDALGRVVPVGAVGAGHAMKALNNLLSATHLWITGEVMAAGEQFGLDPAVMLEVFNSSSGRSGSTEKKWPQFVMTESFGSGFGLQLMLKDMRIAVELSERAGAFHSLGDQAVRLWAEAAMDLSTTADHTEIARWIEQKEGSRSAIL